MRSILIFLSVFFYSATWAQSQDEVELRYYVVGEDTIPIVDVGGVVVSATVKPLKFRNKQESRKYQRLLAHVKKVYPYAQLAAEKLKECEAEIEKHPENKRKEMKKVEKALKDKYGPELKRLTMTQGRILLLLIDRQTGGTTYELVKELRGGFSATLYQGIALLFNSNLKSEYDPDGEHWMIEMICRRIERGEIKL